MSATTTQLLSSGEFYKLLYDTIPVKNSSANVSFCTNNSKMSNFELWYSCRKWAYFTYISSPPGTWVANSRGWCNKHL